ncbi:cytochrome P450 [Mollisia scopiformis]|uniref:Cytochrome P450 n=1 Tax=Mollisia scopiformis TaxID=149040 RepID=A0A194X072_MOLSC|nr:cytochrome P450 [Mollisia scopiformis]KUJ13354.1 cytochrome P450 [Mollisia scopiformis]
MQALGNEIDTMETAGKISNPVTFAETQQMPYLQAVIKEALRMHPATGLPLGRVVPPGGKLIAGYAFPEGTIVGINSWVAHANPKVFGEDATVFRPERWLESKEKSVMLDKYFFSFGMGSRTCIGKNISLLEMSKLVPQLIRNFDNSLEEPDQAWKTTNGCNTHPFSSPQLNLRLTHCHIKSDRTAYSGDVLGVEVCTPLLAPYPDWNGKHEKSNFDASNGVEDACGTPSSDLVVYAN